MEPRISVVTLAVADAARSAAFYRALGWHGSTPDGDVWFFQAGGLVVALWDAAEAAADAGTTTARGFGVTLAHNVRSPAQVDAVLDEAAAAGATVVRRGAPTSWGGYSGVFHDPDGYPWEVAHNPFWHLDDAGHVTLPDTSA